MLARYLGRRFFNASLLLIGLSFACFLLLDLAPGSFYDEMRLNPAVSAATVAALRSSQGLGRPLFERYGAWAASAVRGDFGISFAYGQPASQLVIPRIRNTLLLSGCALLLAWLIALPLGVMAAARPHSFWDRVFGFGSSVLVTIPELVLGCLAILFLARTGWLPVGGMVSTGFKELGPIARWLDIGRHLIVPTLVLAAGTVPMVFRHARSAIRDVSGAPFVQAARGRGIGPARLLYRHILPAAAGSLISLAGLSLGGLLSASLVVEVVAGWPGLGPLLLEAIAARDVYVIIDVVLLSGVVLACANLLADLALYYCDPRVRVH